MCELPGTEMDKSTAPQRETFSAFDAINTVFAPAINRAEANADRIHQAWLDCQQADQEESNDEP